MTFSLFAWRCTNMHGSGVFTDSVMLLLGLAFVAGSFLRDLRLGPRGPLPPGSGTPAGFPIRVIMFLLGWMVVFQGVKRLVLCP